MDYKDLLSNIQKENEKRLQDILSRNQAVLNSYRNPAQEKPFKEPHKIDRLVRDHRLSQEAQTKIGTFEKLYFRNYLEDSKVPMYGYEDLDYASLVNLLTSALEVELNLSVYQEIRRTAGNEELYLNGKEINLGKPKQMYGALLALFTEYKGIVARYVCDVDTFLADFSDIAKTRNRASHTEVISKQEFLAFYASYSNLFNTNIGKLLDLKENLKKESRVNTSYSASYDVSSDDYVANLKKSLASKQNSKRGVILTNTKKLAHKYFGAINYGNVSASEDGKPEIWSYSLPILNKLAEYAKHLEQYGCSYTILDLGHSDYGYILEERDDWRACLDILDDYCSRNDISGENPVSLFIIGGDDVIPVPQFHNPGQDVGEEIHDINELDNTVDSDLPYAYCGSDVKLTKKGELSLDALSSVIGKPRFYVGRLPMESGFMKTSIKDDVYSYLDRASQAFSESGMCINAPLMTTCRNAMAVGSFVVDGIPVVKDGASSEEMTKGEMITSPALAVEDDPDGRFRQTGLEDYASILSRSDMLIFLLHGGGAPTTNSYYGDYTDETLGRINPKAFAPEMLSCGTIKNIATVSCFGAKYIGYDRAKSMLLSALYKDTICFVGASRTAFGDFDDSMEKGVRHPRYSGRMMNYYLRLLFSGVPAAEALQKAKIKFMDGVVAQKYGECIGIGMTTLLEFNYYGDPMLWMQPRISEAELYSTSGLAGYSSFGDSWSRDYKKIELPSENRGGFLARVRNAVDRNFSDIHSIITERLYDEWGLEPRELYRASSFKSADGESGYLFRYKHSDNGINTFAFAEADDKGQIKTVYYTY